MDDGQERLGEQSVAARPGVRVEVRGLALPPEGVDGDDDEGGRGDERDAEEAAARTVRGVARAEVRDGAPARARDESAARPAKPDRLEPEQRDEQQRPAAEEARRLPDRAGRGQPEQPEPDERDGRRGRDGREAARPFPAPTLHAPALDDAREEPARRGAAQPPHRPVDAGERDEEAAQRAEEEGARRRVERERRGADGLDPPRAQAVHHQRAVGVGPGEPERSAQRGEHEGFGQEDAADARLAEADRAQDADLAQALFDAEAEEERRQHQGRSDEEEAEVEEVFSEVGRALRSLQPLGADGEDCQPVLRRVYVLAQPLPERVGGRLAGGSARRHDAHGGQLAEARLPELLPVREFDESLRRRAVGVPVLLVLRADAREVDGERGIPVGEAARLGDAGVLGHEVAVGGEAFERDDAGHAEPGLARHEPPRFHPQVILQRQAVAGARAQLPRRPLVEDDGRERRSVGRGRRPRGGRRAGGGLGLQLLKEVVADGGDERVGDGAVVGAEAVGEVGEDGDSARAAGSGRALGRGGEPFADERALALHGEAAAGVERAQAHAHVFEREVIFQDRAEPRGLLAPVGARALTRRDEQRVGPALPSEVLLQLGELDEDGADGRLRGAHGELAHPLGRERAAHLQPRRAPDVVLAPVERLDGDVRRLLDPDEQRLALARAQLPGEGRAQEHLARARGLRPDAVELEEARVHAVDLHAGRARPALLARRRAFEHDDGDGRLEPGGGEGRVTPRLVRQTLAEEVGRGHDQFRPPEPLQKEPAQGGAHRVADEQRAREHGDRHADARDDRQIRPPVVSEPAPDEEEGVHK